MVFVLVLLGPALPASSNSPSAELVQQGTFGMRAAMSADAQAGELMQWFLFWGYLAQGGS